MKNEAENLNRVVNDVLLEIISPITSVSNLRFKFEQEEENKQDYQRSDEEDHDVPNVNNSLNFV